MDPKREGDSGLLARVWELGGYGTRVWGDGKRECASASVVLEYGVLFGDSVATCASSRSVEVGRNIRDGPAMCLLVLGREVDIFDYGWVYSF